MEKYKLWINQYDITTNDYKVREEEVETNDIYHTIGKIYCSSITQIKRIDYQKIDKEKLLQERIDKAIEYITPIVELDNDIRLKGTMLKPVLEILKGEDKE